MFQQNTTVISFQIAASGTESLQLLQLPQISLSNAAPQRPSSRAGLSASCSVRTHPRQTVYNPRLRVSAPMGSTRSAPRKFRLHEQAFSFSDQTILLVSTSNRKGRTAYQALFSITGFSECVRFTKMKFKARSFRFTSPSSPIPSSLRARAKALPDDRSPLLRGRPDPCPGSSSLFSAAGIIPSGHRSADCLACWMRRNN